MSGIWRTLRRIGPGGWLLAFGAVMAALLALQGIGYARLDDRTVALEELREPGAVGRAEAPNVDDYIPIGHEGHFGKEPKPKPKLFGVLGDQALIGMSENDAKFQGVGAGLPGGYKLVEVQPSAVVIESEGEKETLQLWPDMGTPGRARPRRSRRPRPTGRRPQPPEAEEPETVQEQTEPASAEPPGDAMPVIPDNLPIPPQVRQRMIEELTKRWSSMSDEEKNQVRQRLQEMGSAM